MEASSVSSEDFHLHEEDEGISKEFKELISSFPKTKGWYQLFYYQYQGFWYPPRHLQAAMACNKHLEAHNSDVFVISTPKSGTLWLKALTFAIVNRTRYSLTHHPLLNTNPHDLVPFLEIQVYADDKVPDLTNIPSPRLFATHIPHTSLPKSVIESNSRIVYLCRNPKDTFVSLWHFINRLRAEMFQQPPLPLLEAFEMFCNGVSSFGPFWDHVLGYWKESLARPDRILFLKYEEIKQEPMFYLKRLAKFLGCPFTLEEEREGVVEEILKLCSFKKLSDLEVNKTGKTFINIENNLFFRRGEVGDWTNNLTLSMIERLNHVTDQKLHGSGLTFQVSLEN
ncbi:cytosolic sulfotransferase 15-like [Tasmannia lanceolata]|uniref:cytosolic sulfotransferase 15-like n=1 Tax=Tasmannia lanceolata TaxID=3420 RepID=UPI004062E55E